jgi:ribosomal protein S11
MRLDLSERPTRSEYLPSEVLELYALKLKIEASAELVDPSPDKQVEMRTEEADRREKFASTFFPSELSDGFFTYVEYDDGEDELGSALESEFEDVEFLTTSEPEALLSYDLNSTSKLEEEKSEEEDSSEDLTVTPNKVVTIRIKPNNVFCTMRNTKTKSVVSASCTKYKVKMSKKSLKHNYKLVVKSFLKNLPTLPNSTKVLVCLTAPKRVRKELFGIFNKSLDLNQRYTKQASGSVIRNSPNVLLFKFHAKKCFNGCRARKKRRSKQRGLRVYKS